MYFGKRRFRIGRREYAIQGLVFGRPQFLYAYNDGETKWRDFGPVRIYRHMWREAA